MMYNTVIIHAEIWDNDDALDIMNNVPDTLLQMHYMQSMMDGSGDTTEMSTEITTTSVRTTISMITNITTNTTLQTSSTTLTSSSTTTTSSTSTSSTTSTSPSFQPGTCSNSSDVPLNDGTCIPKTIARKNSVDTIRSNSNDSDAKADALILYFRAADNLNPASDKPDTLTPREVDDLIDGLNNIRVRNFSNLFIMARSSIDGNSRIVGALSRYNLTNEIITNTSKTDIINSNLAAAASMSGQSLNDISNIKMFIVNEPTAYKNLNPSNNQLLVSPVIVVGRDRKDKESSINITLYFQLLTKDETPMNGRYSCSFLDTNSLTWNESGCALPQYNSKYDRYECMCNHLTTFALIWLPNTLQPTYLTAQDIASLIFLSISILCFIAVILHSLITRLLNPAMSLEPRDLLPLISSASTMLVFIFYIALTMTVYTRISSSSSTPVPCFPSASVLMFFVYFFLIFMFCIKTSVGYFNYLRFVQLFPQPSHRKLFILLIISFFISIIWTSFAAGFNSNSSFNITQLHGNKLCWFTRDVIYYFMTIPVSIFLLLNLTTIILVAKRIISHARNSTSPHQSYERMKRCVLVLLSSCLTQGAGWLFGPFITFVDPTAADILGWFFIIFSGLEGLWIILLYMIIRSQRADEPQRNSDNRKRINKIPSSSIRSGKERKRTGLSSLLARRFQVTHRNARKEPMVFSDLYDEETTEWTTSTC